MLVRLTGASIVRGKFLFYDIVSWLNSLNARLPSYSTSRFVQAPWASHNPFAFVDICWWNKHGEWAENRAKIDLYERGFLFIFISRHNTVVFVVFIALSARPVRDCHKCLRYTITTHLLCGEAKTLLSRGVREFVRIQRTFQIKIAIARRDSLRVKDF